MGKENDIEARLVLTDAASKPMKAAEKNITESTEKINTGGKKVKSVFDGANFSLSLVTKTLGFLKRELAQDADVAELFTEGGKALGNAIEYLVFSLTPGIKTFEEFKAHIEDVTAAFAASNLSFEKTSMDAAITRITRANAALEDGLPGLQSALEDVHVPASWLSEFGGAYTDTLNALNTKWRDLNRVQALVAQGLTRSEAQLLLDNLKKRAQLTERSTEAWVEQSVAIAKINDELKQHRYERDTFTGGYQKEVESIDESFLHLGRVAGRFASDAHKTISNDLFAAVKRDGITLAAFFDHLFDGILHQLTDAASAGLLSLGSSVLGGLFSPSLPSNQSPIREGASLNLGGDIPNIPHFAGGGHVTEPTIAVVGDGGEGEHMIPDSKFERLMSGRGENHTWNINISAVDGPSVEKLFASGVFRRRVLQEVGRGAQFNRALRGRLDVS